MCRAKFTYQPSSSRKSLKRLRYKILKKYTSGLKFKKSFESKGSLEVEVISRRRINFLNDYFSQRKIKIPFILKMKKCMDQRLNYDFVSYSKKYITIYNYKGNIIQYINCNKKDEDLEKENLTLDEIEEEQNRLLFEEFLNQKNLEYEFARRYAFPDESDSDSDTNSDISYISEGEEVLYDANRIFNDNLNSDRIEWCNMHNITMQQMDDMRLVNPDFSISTFFVLLPDAIHDLFFIHLEYFETGYWRH